MSEQKLKEAIATLRDELERTNKHGHLQTAPKSALSDAEDALSLPRDLSELYRLANPVDVELPWVAEWLTLYPVEELEASQEGYRFESGKPEELDPCWNPHWIVIGDASADPIIVDARSPEAPVLVAIHGTGSWSPEGICPSLADFVLLLSNWLQIWSSFNGKIWDDDYNVLPAVHTAIAEQAAFHLPEDERKNLMTFLG